VVQILNSRSNRKRLEVLRAAAGEFRRRGFGGTGMREIAAAMGVQPGALYYYFKSKEEILYFVQDWSLDRMLEAARQVVRGPAPVRLRTLIVAQMRCMLDELGGSAAHMEFTALPPAMLAKIVAKRDRYERTMRRVVEDGMRTGAFRRGDAKLATLAILGAINWSIRWYRPGGDRTVDEIANAFADLLVRGLANRGSRITNRGRKK